MSETGHGKTPLGNSGDVIHIQDDKVDYWDKQRKQDFRLRICDLSLNPILQQRSQSQSF